MIAMFLYIFLAFGAVLAIGAMIATWRRHAPAWHRLAAERRSRDRAAVRAMLVRANGEPVPLEFRVLPLIDRRYWHERRAAA